MSGRIKSHVVRVGDWEMIVPRKVADDPEEVAKVREVLRMIGEIERGERNENIS